MVPALRRELMQSQRKIFITLRVSSALHVCVLSLMYRYGSIIFMSVLLSLMYRYGFNMFITGYIHNFFFHVPCFDVWALACFAHRV